MAFAINDMAPNSKGGTELLRDGLARNIDPALLDHFHITLSRVRDIDHSKIKIWWAHDLPGDPESQFLQGGGWNKFDKLVFVSNWQWQQYQRAYGIPWHKSVVILNAAESLVPALHPFPEKPKPTPIRIIYHSTPHRGLDILYAVFNKLCEKHDDIVLDVFSSFKLYGWEQRDEPYKALFDALKAHPKVTYHGTQPNEVVREALMNSHIFAYPSTWQETSCLCLMEAMMAGCVCVHPNYAALPETAANWTTMYQWQEDPRDHASVFYAYLDNMIDLVRQNSTNLDSMRRAQSQYANNFYSWDLRKLQWTSFLRGLMVQYKR